MMPPDHDLWSAAAASLADHLRAHIPQGREPLRLRQLRPRRDDAAAALADQGALIAASDVVRRRVVAIEVQQGDRKSVV